MCSKAGIHTHTQPFNGLLSGTTRVGWYQKKQFTHSHPSWSSDILYHLPPIAAIHGIPLCSVYELDSRLGQPLSRSSLVFLLALGPQIHTPCISSPNHRHLFAAHAHTSAACFAAIPMLCHLYVYTRLKTFFCKYFPLQPFFFFFRTYYMDFPDCLLLLLSISVSLLFSFFLFLHFFSCRFRAVD